MLICSEILLPNGWMDGRPTRFFWARAVPRFTEIHCSSQNLKNQIEKNSKSTKIQSNYTIQHEFKTSPKNYRFFSISILHLFKMPWICWFLLYQHNFFMFSFWIVLLVYYRFSCNFIWCLANLLELLWIGALWIIILNVGCKFWKWALSF